MSLNIFLTLEFTKPASSFGGIGAYVASLLEAITAFGSVSAAARVMKANPPKLRRLVRNINEDSGDIIILKRGRSGGALVTAEGLARLQQYRMIEEGIRRVFAKDLRDIEKLIGSDPQMPRPWLEYDRWRQLSPRKIENPKRRAHAIKSTVNSTPALVHVYLALFSEKLWIGEGDILTLLAIARYGSIAAAARAMGRSYYDVKNRIRSMNRDLGEIVLTQRGRGGGAMLTPRGTELTERFCRIQSSTYDIFARELAFVAQLAGGDKEGRKFSPDYARRMELIAKLGKCDDICIRSGVGTVSH
jgi:molybdate transport repressor ModE-like protein